MRRHVLNNLKAHKDFLMLSLDRKVGLESQKSYKDKVKSGFFDKYLAGEKILDVGFAGHEGDGQPIVPQAIGST